MKVLHRTLCAVSLLALAMPAAARAHALLPAALGLHEVGPAQYRGSFRRPPQLAAALTPLFPSDCQVADQTTIREADQQVDHFTLTCRASLAGRTVHIAGLVGVELSALVHVVHSDGAEARALLTPVRPSFSVPPRATPWTVLADYVRLGLIHLATGLDHVLFIAGLCLLVSDLRRRILILSAFTLGHSLTLCLAALDLVRLPQAPVEIAIAASLMVLAHEVLRPSPRMPTAWLAPGFGLLHGLGFASALAETGLSPKAVALSLLGFNLGIELGQLAVVLVLLPVGFVLRRMAEPKRLEIMRAGAAYALGSLAAMWCIERALTLGG